MQLGSKPNHPEVDSTWESLALTRFLLAMIVVVTHVHEFSTNALFVKVENLSAYVAVVCFLMVSGFSIAHSVSRGTRGFYRRRFLRIYPLYAIAVIVPVTVQAARGHLWPHDVSNALQNLLFLQTYTTRPLIVNSVVWTLAVEVACYILAPLLVRLRTATLIAIAGVSCLAYASYPESTRYIYQQYYAYIAYGGSVLLLGWAWLAGFIYYRHKDHPYAAITLGLSVFLLMTLNPLFTDRFYEVTMVLTIAAITMGRKLALPTRTRKVMLFLGDLSFPLYLLHLPTYHLFAGLGHVHSSYLLLCTAMASAAVGLVIDAQLKRPVRAVVDAVYDAAVRLKQPVVSAAAGLFTNWTATAGRSSNSNSMSITEPTESTSLAV